MPLRRNMARPPPHVGRSVSHGENPHRPDLHRQSRQPRRPSAPADPPQHRPTPRLRSRRPAPVCHHRISSRRIAPPLDRQTKTHRRPNHQHSPPGPHRPSIRLRARRRPRRHQTRKHPLLSHRRLQRFRRAWLRQSHRFRHRRRHGTHRRQRRRRRRRRRSNGLCRPRATHRHPTRRQIRHLRRRRHSLRNARWRTPQRRRITQRTQPRSPYLAQRSLPKILRPPRPTI